MQHHFIIDTAVENDQMKDATTLCCLLQGMEELIPTGKTCNSDIFSKYHELRPVCNTIV